MSDLTNFIDARQADLLRSENGLAKDIIDAYNKARLELVAVVNDRYALLGDDPTPEQIRQLATNLELIRAIERRLAQLETDLGQVIETELTKVANEATAAAEREIRLMAEKMGIPFNEFQINELLELTIGPAVDQVPGLVGELKSNLLGELREGLASGERFSQISKRIFGKVESVFSRGITSAELMARRAVIQAENNAKMIYYEQSKKQIPGLKKQVLASIQSDTTKTCLMAHGQIKELEEPFVIEGKPSFGRLQMQPPFHWNCRTMVAPYHVLFEEFSGLTTDKMVAEAKKELATR